MSYLLTFDNVEWVNFRGGVSCEQKEAHTYKGSPSQRKEH